MASVKIFVKIENPELEIELPVERNDKGDDFILMSALEDKFPGAKGLKFKAETWQDLIVIDQKILLQKGWDQNCRYYVVYQRNDPEDIDKLPSKKFKATRFEFANVSQDIKSLYQAAQITQLFLNTDRFRLFLLKFRYKLDENFFSEKIKSILIRFFKQAPKCIASIDRFDNNANIISINDLYKSRIDQIDENSEEYKNIIVQLAFVIFHEIGHLLLKWKGGIQCSTEFYPTCLEAGEYLERGLFLYPVNLLLSFRKKWTKNTRILGIGLETYNGRNIPISMIKPSYIEYFYQRGLDYENEKSDSFDETSIELLPDPLPKGHYARKIQDEFTKFVNAPLQMQAIAISPCDSRKWPDQKNSSTNMPEIDLNKTLNQVLRAASLVNGLVYGTNEIIEVFESGQTVELCIAASDFDEHDLQRIEGICQKYDVTLFKDQEKRTLSKYTKRDRNQLAERKVPLCVAITNWGQIGDAHADLKKYFEYLDDE